MRTTRLDAPDGARGTADRRSHDRRRYGPSWEPVGSGYSAAPQFAPVRLDARCHQRRPGNRYLPGGPLRARGAGVLYRVLSPHPPPRRSGDHWPLPRYRGHRPSLNCVLLCGKDHAVRVTPQSGEPRPRTLVLRSAMIHGQYGTPGPRLPAGQSSPAAAESLGISLHGAVLPGPLQHAAGSAAGMSRPPSGRHRPASS